MGQDGAVLIRRRVLDAIADGLGHRALPAVGPAAGARRRPQRTVRASADLTDDDRAAIATRLARMDRREPWTGTVLRLIAERPGVRAPDLAASLGRETLPFQRDVRELTEPHREPGGGLPAVSARPGLPAAVSTAFTPEPAQWRPWRGASAGAGCSWAPAPQHSWV
jgi:hypothetical protein